MLLQTPSSRGIDTTPAAGEVFIAQQRAYSIVGMAAPGTVGIAQQRAYAIIYP